MIKYSESIGPVDTICQQKKSHTEDYKPAPRKGKTTAIRCTAVRETCVSRNHEGPIEGPPCIPSNITALSHREV